MKKWKVIVSIMIVFFLGTLSGALLTYKIHQQRVEGFMRGDSKMTREFIVRRLNHELHLDPSQLEQVKTIVRETHIEMRNLRREFRPQTEEILARSQDKIRAILRPDQIETYEKIVAERKKKREVEDNNR